MARRALMLREGKAPVWDRLLAMLFLVALLHGMIIIGLTFNAHAADRSAAPGLAVLLVSDELPEADRNPTATYLAQRTQVGSGNTREQTAPHNRSSALPRLQHPGTADGDSLGGPAEASGSADSRVLTSTAWNTTVHYLADTGAGPTASRDKPLLVDTPETVQPGPTDEDSPAQLRGPQRNELWITPDTRAAALAPYLDGWRRKVERIGTLNFPAAARAAGAASPVVEVGIDSSGKLDRAVIRSSSGNPELDQAALAILRLASPFDPFPPELSNQYRVLRFSYEWQFTGGRATGGTVSALP